MGSDGPSSKHICKRKVWLLKCSSSCKICNTIKNLFWKFTVALVTLVHLFCPCGKSESWWGVQFFLFRKEGTYVSHTEQWWQRSGFSTWQRSQNLIAREKMRTGWINDTWAEPTLQPPPRAKKWPLMSSTNEMKCFDCLFWMGMPIAEAVYLHYTQIRFNLTDCG